ncbi:MAG TPA: 4-hydroxy-3-methylbut-2-enyl diphosphate reductase, partial [Candidatus Aphodoplasma excrementigallinarum]|nr:4-hydroxy-3-methylbut-2-enyl diphosphate reductase [Candidatus Aphodoplasma excrementigallinarum]
MGQKIEIAKSAGFCFGVKKAVGRVYELVKVGEKIAVLGELIHNRTVTDDLERKGVVTTVSYTHLRAHET